MGLSVIMSDGTEATAGGPRPVRRRAATLTAEDAARLNDLLYVLLVDELGQSPADAVRVLSCRANRGHRNRRVAPLRAVASRRGVLAVLLDFAGLARLRPEAS